MRGHKKTVWEIQCSFMAFSISEAKPNRVPFVINSIVSLSFLWRSPNSFCWIHATFFCLQFTFIALQASYLVRLVVYLQAAFRESIFCICFKLLRQLKKKVIIWQDMNKEKLLLSHGKRWSGKKGTLTVQSILPQLIDFNPLFWPAEYFFLFCRQSQLQCLVGESQYCAVY